MGVELVLASFGGESDHGQPSVKLNRLEGAVRGTLRKAKRTNVDVTASEDRLLVNLPGGTAEIHADHAQFPIEHLDPLTLSIVFEVAKTGDMVVLTEGGNYSAIVLDASQRPQLPEEWQTENASPLCRSPKELGRLLENWYGAHADFQKKAVADIAARSEPATPLSSPAGTSYRWDPVRDEFVEISKESEVVDLYRFDPSGNEVPKSPDVIRQLKTVCQQYLQRENPPHSRLVDDQSWPPLSVRFSDSSADVWPGRAIFNFYDLTPSLVRLMFEVAREADFSIIAPSALILTDPGQAARIPKTWKRSMKVVSCQSAEELGTWLKTLQLDIPLDERDYGFGDEGPIPGTFPSRGRTVYVEAKPKETAAQHQKKVYKHKPQNTDQSAQPEDGLLGAEFWQLETPSGTRFYAYEYAGEGWLDYLRDFARSNERVLGSIVNFEKFTQDDGQQFPIRDCKVRKADR